MKYAQLMLFSVCMLLASQGCTNSSSPLEELKVEMNTWLGRTEAELIAERGPPPYIRDDGQGGRILIYGQAGNFCKMYYISIYGRIYNWRFAVF